MRNVVELENQTLAQKRFNADRLAAILNNAYLAQRRESSDRAKKSFAPSGIGYGAGTCPRQWWYAFSGGILREDDADPVGIANMSYGTEAHARIQKLFEEAGILVEAERKVVTDDLPDMPPIFGFADLVINWQGEEVVGEIKTTSQESYVSKRAKNQPAGYHLLQVLIYMRVLGLNKGFILYENKNTQNMLIIPVTWNAVNTKLADDTFEWMQTVYDNWAGSPVASDKPRGLPKRPFKSNRSPACKSCAFLSHCWTDAEGIVELPVLEVPK